MKTKIIIAGICVLFAVCGYLVNFRSMTNAKPKGIALAQSLGQVPRWQLVKKTPLLDVIVKELQLDDYLNQTYTNGKDLVSLYVGYYHTSKKVGASHDPMVCFPGQGWQIENSSRGWVAESKNIKTPFEYASMVAELGEDTQLLIYWFQAYDEPARTTFLQKMKLAGKKLAGKGEDNAFVRFTMPCNSKEFDSCRQVILDFIDNFYPPFLEFVTTDAN